MAVPGYAAPERKSVPSISGIFIVALHSGETPRKKVRSLLGGPPLIETESFPVFAAE
jgi:hypothetical protein